jgi:hypothetical protein
MIGDGSDVVCETGIDQSFHIFVETGISGLPLEIRCCCCLSNHIYSMFRPSSDIRGSENITHNLGLTHLTQFRINIHYLDHLKTCLKYEVWLLKEWIVVCYHWRLEIYVSTLKFDFQWEKCWILSVWEGKGKGLRIWQRAIKFDVACPKMYFLYHNWSGWKWLVMEAVLLVKLVLINLSIFLWRLA